MSQDEQKNPSIAQPPAVTTDLPQEAPVQQPQAGQPPGPSAQTMATNSEMMTVLLVEDDPLLVKMYRSKFEKEGFAVLTADDGEKGLQMATTANINFLVLDLMMPKLSGLELLQKLRQTEIGKNLPVIILSNLANPPEINQAKALGVKDFLFKANLTPGQVVEKVKQYLS